MERVAGAVGEQGAEVQAAGDGLHRCNAASGRARLRVLLIGHQFQVPTEGQAKAAALAAFPDLEVRVLAPSLYREGEVRWRRPVVPDAAAYQFESTPVRLPWSGPAKWYLQSYPKLASVLRAFRPDVIDIWEEPWSVLSAQVCRLRNRLLPGARIISETEQNISKVLPPPFEWLRRYTFKNADFLIGRNTEAVRVACLKGYAGPAAVVGNGVDMGLFNPEGCTKQGQQDCSQQRPFVVGYAGRLVPEKGLDLLIEAVGRLPKPRSLVVSGEGPSLGRLLHCGFVKWSGSVPREALPEFYRGLSVLVLPSLTTPRWKEQFGRVLVEAQACGVPVVGSSSGAIPEVIGSAGLVFREGDADGLHAQLQRLSQSEELRRSLGEAGRRRACDLYAWESIATQMRKVYQAVCQSARAVS